MINLKHIKTATEAKKISRNLKIYYVIPKITSNSTMASLTTYQQRVIQAVNKIRYDNTHASRKVQLLEALLFTEVEKKLLFPHPQAAEQQKCTVVAIAVMEIAEALRKIENMRFNR